MKLTHHFAALALTLATLVFASRAGAGAPCLTYQDNDGDLYGNAGVTSSNCPTTGWVLNSTDCNDTSSAVNPGATEIPGDNVDQNCNFQELCYFDNDNDGYRPSNSTFASIDSDCTDGGEAAFTDPIGDCNDNNSSVRPNATELPGDSIDFDCNGSELCFVDADDDGYRPGSGNVVLSPNLICNDLGEAIPGDPIGDCNDNDDTVKPGAMDLCDGIDNDCSGIPDDGVACIVADAGIDAGNDASSDAATSQAGAPGDASTSDAAIAAGGTTGSTSTDAASDDDTTPDSGSIDNSPVVDGSTAAGGMQSIGEPHTTGSMQDDAGTQASDAGSAGTGSESGCNCRTAGRAAPSQSMIGGFTLLFSGISILRRSRRLPPSHRSSGGVS